MRAVATVVAGGGCDCCLAVLDRVFSQDGRVEILVSLTRPLMGCAVSLLAHPWDTAAEHDQAVA